MPPDGVTLFQADFLEIRGGIMKKTTKVILFLLLSLTLLTIVPLFTNPVRRPVSSVRNYILRRTPVGTDIEDVIEFIDSQRNWELLSISRERGFRHPNPAFIPRQFTEEELRYPIDIGEKSIIVHVEPYRAWYKFLFIVPTHAAIFFGFDADGKLIDVHVWKTYDIL